MENLIIGALASLVIFALFFSVFLLRERGNTTRGRHHGCGQPDGPCRCRQADASIQPFPPPETIAGTAPCPDAHRDTETLEDI